MSERSVLPTAAELSHEAVPSALRRTLLWLPNAIRVAASVRFNRYVMRGVFQQDSRQPAELRELWQLLDAEDPSVAFAYANTCKDITLLPDETHDRKSIWTDYLHGCASLLVYGECPDGAKGAIQTHYYPQCFAIDQDLDAVEQHLKDHAVLREAPHREALAMLPPYHGGLRYGRQHGYVRRRLRQLLGEDARVRIVGYSDPDRDECEALVAHLPRQGRSQARRFRERTYIHTTYLGLPPAVDSGA